MCVCTLLSSLCIDFIAPVKSAFIQVGAAQVVYSDQVTQFWSKHEVMTAFRCVRATSLRPACRTHHEVTLFVNVCFGFLDSTLISAVHVYVCFSATSHHTRNQN